ncbi:MAG: hypothetical protein WBG29_07500, partial [Candidatus Acidiferrales bacterium]
MSTAKCGSETPKVSEFLTHRRLASEKEGFRVFSGATDLERPKVLIPGTLWRVGFGFAPQFELIEVLDRNLTVANTFKEMIAQGRGQRGPLNLGHLFAEGQASEFFLDAFPLGGVRGGAQLVRKFEESAFLGFSRFDSGFNQFYQDMVGAGALILGDCSDAASQARRKRDALAYGLFGSCHEDSVHRNAPLCTILKQFGWSGNCEARGGVLMQNRRVQIDARGGREMSEQETRGAAQRARTMLGVVAGFLLGAMVFVGGRALAQHNGSNGAGDAVLTRAGGQMGGQGAAAGPSDAEHVWLAKLAGEYNRVIKFVGQTGANAAPSSGTSKFSVVLGGRFI